MPVYHDPEDAPTDLQRLLLRAVPVNEFGHKSIRQLAKSLGLSRWAVQKWITNDKMTPSRAMQVVDLSEGRVALSDFSRFIYKL